MQIQQDYLGTEQPDDNAQAYWNSMTNEEIAKEDE
jgi:hypothetical protein